MRMLIERFVRQLPHALERRIMQPDAAVAAEHRHRLGQMIERLALHLDERVVAAVHVQPLGDVVVEICDAAFRIGRGDDAQRAAVRQMPHVLLRLDDAIGLVQLLFPLPEILLLGQLAFTAQCIEHRRIGRRLVEKAGVEFEQRTKGGVVEGKFAVDIKDGDAGRELVEHAAMRLDHAREFGAHRFDFGAVDRDARAASSARRINDLEDAASTCGDCRQAGRHMSRLRARARATSARAAAGQAVPARAPQHRQDSRLPPRAHRPNLRRPAGRRYRAPRPGAAANRAAPVMVSTSLSS